MGISRRNFIRLGLAGATVAAVPTLASCGSSTGSSTPATNAGVLWRWHGSPDYSERVQQVIELINTNQPTVKLRGESISSSDDFYNKLATEVAGGGGPDMFSMVDDQRANYADKGVLYDFTPNIGKELQVQDLPPELLDYFRIDGKLVGIPRTIDCKAMIYDQSKFDELGIAPPAEDWSFEDYRTLVAEMGKKIGTGKNYWPTEDAGGDFAPFATWVYSRGKQVYDGAGLGFDSTDLNDWWTFWADLRKAGLAPPPDVMSGTKKSLDTFLLAQGKAAFGFGASRHIYGLQAVTKSTLGEVPNPDALKPGSPGDSISPGDSVAANAKTEVADQMLMAMNERINNIEIAKFLGMSGGIPAGGEAIISQLSLEPIDDKIVKTVQAVQKKGGPVRQQAPIGAGEVEDNLGLLGEKIAFGELTIAQGVDQFFSEAEKALEA